jgi:hypothetical protein
MSHLKGNGEGERLKAEIGPERSGKTESTTKYAKDTNSEPLSGEQLQT